MSRKTFIQFSLSLTILLSGSVTKVWVSAQDDYFPGTVIDINTGNNNNKNDEYIRSRSDASLVKYKNWVSDIIPEGTRLCDMSIPMASDVCSHYPLTPAQTHFGFMETQSSDAATLFDYGVRAFEMVLSPEEGIANEINKHFPSSGNLDGEFLFLFLRWDSYYDVKKYKDKYNKAYDDVLNALINRYGREKFSDFKSEYTYADVKGKIILVTQDNSAETLSETYNVPVARFQYLDSSPKHVLTSYSKGQQIGETTFFVQAKFTNDIYEKKKAIRNGFTDWFDYLQSPSSENNNFHAFNISRIDINANEPFDNRRYYSSDIEINRDHDCTPGTNRSTLDFIIKSNKLPLGFVCFNFVGEQEYDAGWVLEDFIPVCGSLLLRFIIRNNEFIKQYHNSETGKYIKDIIVAGNENKEKAQNFLYRDSCVIRADNGIIRSTNSGVSDNYYVFIGYKTTNNPDSAVTDAIVVNPGETVAPLELTINGRIYKQANTRFFNFDGNLNNGIENAPRLYLYYTKDPGDKVLMEATVINQKSSLIEDEMLADYYEIKDGELKKSDNPANLLEGMAPKELYLSLKRHAHSASNLISSYEKINTHHVTRCCECLGIIKSEEHLFSEWTGNEGYTYTHYRKCEKCNYTDEESCKYKPSPYDNGEYEKLGIGICSVCNTTLFQPADTVMTKGYVEYQINNPGQLYWYANQINHHGRKVDAFLNADLDFSLLFPEGVDLSDVSFPWEPIGFGENLFYRYTFDGRGHIISGLKYSGVSLLSIEGHGLFGKIGDATVKNLGIINSSFNGNKNVGSIAGYMAGSKLYNVFSTADVYSQYIGWGGLVGYGASNNIIDNGYYFGNSDMIVWNFYGTNNTTTNTFLSKVSPLGDICDTLNTNVAKHNQDYPDDWTPWCQTLGKENLPTFGTTGITYKRAVSNNWGTLILPYKVVSNDSIRYYTVKSVSVNGNEGVATLEEAEEIPANTPCIFKRLTEGKNLTFGNAGDYEYVEDLSTVVNSNPMMSGTYTKLTDQKDIYFIAQDNFWFADDPITISPFRAWINPGAVNTSMCKVLTICLEENGETTQIGEICDGQLHWFDDGKYMENGQVIIRKNGVKYNTNGQRIE